MSEMEFPQDQEITSDKSDSMETVNDLMSQMLYSAHVEAVYGEPVEHGENLIIPAAELISVAGFGVGEGDGQEGSGKGGGGGGRVFARPVAVIVSSPGGVRVKPIIDISKIWLAALTALGFYFAAARSMRRGRIGKL